MQVCVDLVYKKSNENEYEKRKVPSRTSKNGPPCDHLPVVTNGNKAIETEHQHEKNRKLRNLEEAITYDDDDDEVNHHQIDDD